MTPKVTFSIWVQSHNDAGVKQKIKISEFKHHDEAVRIANRLGIEVRSLYRFFHKERAFEIRERYLSDLRLYHGITLDAFPHEPLFCIKRN